MANEFKVKKGLIVDGVNTVLDIQGTQGQLFSVTDSLTGDLFSVSDVSGIPILNVNSSGLSTFDGNVTIKGDLGIILEDNATGNGLNQWISYRDSAGTERAYVGYGSTGNSTFYVVNYLSDLMLYAGGVLNETKSGANSTFAGTITSGNITINGSSRALVVKSSNDQVVASFVCDGNAISTIGFKGNTGANDYNVRIGADGSSLVAYTVNTVRMTIDSSGDTTFAGVLTVGNSGTSRFTDTSALPLQLNRGLAVDVVGTNGVALGLGSYTTGTTYVDAARIAANLEYDGTTATGDLFLQVNNSGTYSNALTINNDTNATFAGNVTLSSTAPILYLDNTTATTGKNWRLSSAANGKMYIAQDGVVDAITLDHTSGNATFAGTIAASNFSGSSSGTNTGDQDLSGYLTTGFSDYVSKANGGSFGGAVTISGGGNTLMLKKGSGNAALTFAGTATDPEASGLIEGIAGGGLKFYTSNGGTVGTPAWGAKLTIAAAGAATFSGTIAASNFSGSSSGTNTGDQTTVSGNAGTVTNGVYTTGNQSVGGIKTFTSNAIFEEKVIIGDNSVIETTFPASGASLHVHETVSEATSVSLGNEAHVVISTACSQTGAQGYQGSLWFGSSDHPAAGSTAGAGTQFVWRNAGIASTSGTADTGGASATGNLEFYTNSASGTASKRLTIEAGGNAVFAGNVDVDGGTLNVGSSNEVSIVSSGSSHFPSLKVNNNGFLGSASVTDALKLLSSGDLQAKTKIGIGIDPTTLLHIKGTGDAIRVESENTGAGGAQLDLLHFTTSPADADTHASINMGGYYTGTTSVYGTSIKSVWKDVSARQAKLTFTTRNEGNFIEALSLTHEQHAVFSKQIIMESGTGGTTSKLILKTSDNSDESKWIRTNAYWVEHGGHANEGFKFMDTGSNILLQMNGGAQTGGNGALSATFPGSVIGAGGNIGMGKASSTPSVGYGMFHYSGIGLGIYSSAGGGTQGIGFWLNNGTAAYEAGRWLQNGSFGIGTTSPGKTLHVQKDQAAESGVNFMNNSTAAGAAMRLEINVGAPAGNDPMVSFNVGNGGFDWTIGVDNSDSDKFKISGGTDSHNPNLGTNDRLTIPAEGGLDIQGTVGQLFSITNSLTGDLFSVSDISGIPILNVNSSGAVDVDGTFTATGDVVAYSDERLKTNIETLDGSKVYDMRGVSFTKDNKKSSGVIAQELEKIAPELVNNDSQFKAVAYGNITGYLIEAIKDLKAEIEELKSNKCNCNK